MADSVVFITGSAGGLGAAYARHLAARGARVALADIDGDGAEGVAADIRSQGGEALAVRVDISDRLDVDSAVQMVSAEWGGIDILINNAGGNFGPRGPMEHAPDAQWARTLAVNLTGTWLCIQAVIPAMKIAGRGKIINTGTTITQQGYPEGFAPYAAAKGGIDALTRALAREFGPFGITVNALAPGFIPMEKGAASPAAAAIVDALVAEVVDRQSIGRIGDPADLCGLIEFLCSAASDFMTGQILNIDGGAITS